MHMTGGMNVLHGTGGTFSVGFFCAFLDDQLFF